MKKTLIFMIILGLISLLALTACGTVQPVDAGHGQAEQVLGDPFADLRIPYVGSAHETREIVSILQLPGENWFVASIQIGQDHGDFSENFSPYTLTIFYEPRSGSVIEEAEEQPSIPTDIFEENAGLLFELIGNLQAITFSMRFTASENGEADSGIFDYRWSRSRSGEYSLQTSSEIEQDSFVIHIDQMKNVNLGFNILYEVNYNNVFEGIRGFRFDGEGDRLIIWANKPMYNLSLIAVDHVVMDEEIHFFATDTVFTVDELNPANASAFVIDSYYGMGTLPWSGIVFEDESGVRRYFTLQQSGYDGVFRLHEFEPVIVPDLGLS